MDKLVYRAMFLSKDIPCFLGYLGKRMKRGGGGLRFVSSRDALCPPFRVFEPITVPRTLFAQPSSKGYTHLFAELGLFLTEILIRCIYPPPLPLL